MPNEYDYPNLTLHGRFVREQHSEPQADGTKTSVTLPGFFEVGVDVDGVFVPIYRRKAPGLEADIARAAASKSSKSSPSK